MERPSATNVDVEHWPDLYEERDEGQALDLAPWVGHPRQGGTAAKLLVATWIVTELVPGRMFTWEARGPGLRTTGRHDVEPLPDGGCRVTATLDQEGMLGGLLGRLTGGLTASYLALEVHGIKRHCEA